MPSFGEKLRREREKRNITLDQISESTKIGTRMLQALEDDKFNQLPGGIFNKGFVRAYARHIGLDEDQTVAEYLEASGDAPPVQPETAAEEPVHRIEATADETRRQLPWGVFAAILLLVALALSIWSHRQKREQNPAAQTLPSPKSQQVVEQQAPPQPAPQTLSPSSSSGSSPVTAAPIKPAASPAAKMPPANLPAKSTATGATAIPRAAADTNSPPATGEFVIAIQAREDSWTTITADGTTVFSGLLSAGNQHTVHGRNEVTVKAGNAGGIDLRFNGKELNKQGESGQVRTFVFGPSGLQANRAAAPAIQ